MPRHSRSCKAWARRESLAGDIAEQAVVVAGCGMAGVRWGEKDSWHDYSHSPCCHLAGARGSWGATTGDGHHAPWVVEAEVETGAGA